MSSLPPTEAELRAAMRLASAQLDEARARARAEPFEMVHTLTQVARCYRGLRMLPSAEACLLQALRWGRISGSIDAVVDLVCELSETTVALAGQAADAGDAHVARERAREHAFEASTLAGRVSDPSWEVQVLLRISDVLDRCGDRDDAVQLQTRALRRMSGAVAEAPDPALLPSLGRLADS